MAESLVKAVAYAGDSVSKTTQKIYKDDWAAFVAWCAARDAPCLPAPPAIFDAYLAERSEQVGRSGLRLVTAHHQRLDGFDGPMDLLLDLAERRRINFDRISVLSLADQLVAALRRPGRSVPIDRRIDWVILASRLVNLRARLVFLANAKDASGARRDADAELWRLDTLGFIREAARWLDALPQVGREVFRRPRPGRNPRTES
jgi:segregation and condensation protein A